MSLEHGAGITKLQPPLKKRGRPVVQDIAIDGSQEASTLLADAQDWLADNQNKRILD